MQGLDLVKDSDSYSALLKELNDSFPNYVPLLSANLKKLDSLKGQDRTENLSEIIKTANQVQNLIDQEKLAIFLARKTPAEGKGDAYSCYLKQPHAVAKACEAISNGPNILGL